MHTFRLFAACTLLVVGLGFGRTPAMAELPPRLDLARLKNAIVGRLAYQAYWWGAASELRGGTSRPLEVASDGRRFVARIDDFSPSRGGAPEIFVFRGEQGIDRTWITSTGATPIRWMSESVAERARWWESNARFDHRFFVKDSIQIPSVTRPHIDTADKARDHVREVVLRSVQGRLLHYAGLMGRKLPERVTLVLGDFNVGDPVAYALVRELETIFEVEMYAEWEAPESILEGQGPFLARPYEGRPEDQRWLTKRIQAMGEPYRIVPK